MRPFLVAPALLMAACPGAQPRPGSEAPQDEAAIEVRLVNDSDLELKAARALFANDQVSLLVGQPVVRKVWPGAHHVQVQAALESNAGARVFPSIDRRRAILADSMILEARPACVTRLEVTVRVPAAAGCATCRPHLRFDLKVECADLIPSPPTVIEAPGSLEHDARAALVCVEAARVYLTVARAAARRRGHAALRACLEREIAALGRERHEIEEATKRPPSSSSEEARASSAPARTSDAGAASRPAARRDASSAAARRVREAWRRARMLQIEARECR